MRRGIIGLALLAAGCGGSGAIVVPRPAGLTPGSAVEASDWARATIPADPRDIRFRWQVRDDRGAAGGRGRVRLALPDSARLDVAGPLGSGRAAALVSGDTALWAHPEEDVKRLVPNYSLFWALLGIVRGPAAGAVVRKYSDSSMTAWLYQTATDTVEYVRVLGPPLRLVVEVREGGKKVGTVETRFGPDGLPLAARLVVPSGPARLDLSFYSNVKAKPFAPDTWIRPEP